MKKIGFIGGGVMAEAIIKGILAGDMEPGKIYVSDKSQERLAYLHKTLGISVTGDNKAVVSNSQVIILAVKPQNLREAVESFASVLTPDKILVSILAGISTDKIETLLPIGSKVIRAMPNTPALVGYGTTVLTGGKGALEGDLEAASTIFRSVGSVTILPEKMLNAVTGLSGSGPAYIYIIIEALADGGVCAGLSREVAMKLAVETVKGAAYMVEETGMHPGQLKDMVTSPAGTTINGLLQMEKAGLRGVIMDTVLTAARTAEYLARE